MEKNRSKRRRNNALKKFRFKLSTLRILFYAFRIIFLLLSYGVLIYIGVQNPLLLVLLICSMAGILFFSYIEKVMVRKATEKVESEFAYKTLSQAKFDLLNGEILCYNLSGRRGILKYDGEVDKVLLNIEEGPNFFNHMNNEEIDATINKLMDMTKLYKNGIIFKAEISELDSVEELLNMEESQKQQGDN